MFRESVIYKWYRYLRIAWKFYVLPRHSCVRQCNMSVDSQRDPLLSTREALILERNEELAHTLVLGSLTTLALLLGLEIAVLSNLFPIRASGVGLSDVRLPLLLFRSILSLLLLDSGFTLNIKLLKLLLSIGDNLIFLSTLLFSTSSKNLVVLLLPLRESIGVLSLRLSNESSSILRSGFTKTEHILVAGRLLNSITTETISITINIIDSLSGNGHLSSTSQTNINTIEAEIIVGVNRLFLKAESTIELVSHFNSTENVKGRRKQDENKIVKKESNGLRRKTRLEHMIHKRKSCERMRQLHLLLD